jgi:hypothetical protein
MRSGRGPHELFDGAGVFDRVRGHPATEHLAKGIAHRTVRVFVRLIAGQKEP